MLNVRKIWENSNIPALWPDLAASVRFDEPMALHTSFQVGGPADLYVEPSGEEELGALAEALFSLGIPVSLVGGGTNLLVSDKGIRGAVISLARLSSIRKGEETGGSRIVTAGAGVSMETLVEWCADRDISGLERFTGLPGTLGGAAFMNARCYDLSLSEVFLSARVLYFGPSGYTIMTVPKREGEWDYKKSPFQGVKARHPVALERGDSLIASVTLSLSAGSSPDIRREMEKYRADRESKGHFRYPSAGSMFKNDRSFGKPSGAIIDGAGLKGFSVGGARVADWHGNLVINTGGATASDIRTLVEEVRRRVLGQTGFNLEPEVIFAGEW